MTPNKPSPELLKALQVRAARIAIGSSSMRGSSKGVVKAGRAFLNDLLLSDFGTKDQKKFRSALDSATRKLRRRFPKGNQYWGLARKGLTIFLRDCLYTTYLRDECSLERAEPYFEVPLDSLSGRELHKAADGRLPRWRTVRGLTHALSDKYQAIASECADSQRIERVHLDVFWWGSRKE